MSNCKENGWETKLKQAMDAALTVSLVMESRYRMSTARDLGKRTWELLERSRTQEGMSKRMVHAALMIYDASISVYPEDMSPNQANVIYVSLKRLKDDVDCDTLHAIHRDLTDAGLETVAVRWDGTQDEIFARFERLRKRWKMETMFMSNAATIVSHPAYREITAMGEDAIPMIMADMEKGHNHWYRALRDITGSGPEIPEELRGKLQAINEIWLQWLRDPKGREIK